MPSEIQHLIELDYSALFTSVVIFMAGMVALKSLLTKFGEATGIEMPWVRIEREQKERITAIERKVDTTHAEITSIAESLGNLQTTVENLSVTVNSVNERQNANEAAQLKDRISQAYQYYHEKQKWNSMEKEAFNDLIKAYTRYSDNSFVHTVCEPESETWRVIDMN